jgi:hypothetical protein
MVQDVGMLYSPRVTSHEVIITFYQRTLLGTSANQKRHYLKSYNNIYYQAWYEKWSWISIYNYQTLNRPTLAKQLLNKLTNISECGSLMTISTKLKFGFNCPVCFKREDLSAYTQNDKCYLMRKAMWAKGNMAYHSESNLTTSSAMNLFTNN